MYFLVDERGTIAGMSETLIESAAHHVVEIEIPPDHGVYENMYAYRIERGQLVRDDVKALQIAKEGKLEELSAACQREIEAGVTYALDSGVYEFHLDSEAQQNFTMILVVMLAEMADSVHWTAYQNGEVKRVLISKSEMFGLTGAIAEHKITNISKFRDVLAKQVEEAATIEEVEKITW